MFKNLIYIVFSIILFAFISSGLTVKAFNSATMYSILPVLMWTVPVRMISQHVMAMLYLGMHSMVHSFP